MKTTAHPLIIGYLLDTLSPEQRRVFESWRDASDQNRRTFEDFRQIWQLTAASAERPEFQSQAEWAKLEQQLATAKEIPLRPSGYWLKIAAAILLLLLSSSIIYLLLFQAEPITIQSGQSVRHVVLPDNSEVWLNRGSRLTYLDDFTSKRSVQLEGEAFFEIQHDSEKPFVIQTTDAGIEVLGTSFNVKAYSNEEHAEVYVVSGKVRMETIGGKQVVLTRGQKGTLNKEDNNLLVAEDDNQNSISWKNKELVFRKTPLRRVLKDLQSYYGVAFDVKNNRILRCRITATFPDDPSIEDVMDELRLMLNLNTERHRGRYVIDGVGCD